MTRLLTARVIAIYALANCAISSTTGARDAYALLCAAPTGAALAIANALVPLALLLALQAYGGTLLLMGRLTRPLALAIPLIAQVVWFRSEGIAYAFASGLVLGPVMEPSAFTLEASLSWSYWAERRLDGSFEYLGVNLIPVAVLIWLLLNWRFFAGTRNAREAGSAVVAGQ